MNLVVVSGWTGAGKSTLAKELGARLPATVLSFDWIMSGLRVFDDLWALVEDPPEFQREVGWSLMTRVAEQQLARSGSVVLDLVARDAVIARWRDLAASYGAKFSLVECTCTDISVHRSRVEGRQRNIPGWYELSWERVERGRTAYPLLTAPKLSIDAVDPLDKNVEAAWAHIVHG